jgi:hypothetical protein
MKFLKLNLSVLKDSIHFCQILGILVIANTMDLTLVRLQGSNEIGRIHIRYSLPQVTESSLKKLIFFILVTTTITSPNVGLQQLLPQTTVTPKTNETKKSFL